VDQGAEGVDAMSEHPDDRDARAVNDGGRDESEAERIDRNLGELIQELRVASVGVQVLFAFLLSLPFTLRFTELSETQRAVYTADLLLAALATALLIAPAAHHRLTFRQHEKARLLRRGNWFAILGLLTVAAAISGSVLLVLSTVYDSALVPVVAAATAATFMILWFVVPRIRTGPDSY
jgi:hypothetical protein